MSSLYTCTITMLIYKCTFVSLTRDHIFSYKNEVWSMQYEFKHFLCVLYEFIAYISQQCRNYSVFFSIFLRGTGVCTDPRPFQPLPPMIAIPYRHLWVSQPSKVCSLLLYVFLPTGPHVLPLFCCPVICPLIIFLGLRSRLPVRLRRCKVTWPSV